MNDLKKKLDEALKNDRWYQFCENECSCGSNERKCKAKYCVPMIPNEEEFYLGGCVDSLIMEVNDLVIWWI